MNKSKVSDISSWRVQSSDEKGFHNVITPEKSECEVIQIFRLNLDAEEEYMLDTGRLEMNAVLISGSVTVKNHEVINGEFDKFDSFYLPANEQLLVKAKSSCIFYIAGAPFDGIGKAFARRFDKELPLGDMHQIHGEGSGAREVMFTLSPLDSASRLICGLTWSGDGTWTSWPPHQHEKDLEEVYCYFDMPEPNFGFHVSYLESGGIEDCVVHVVKSGTMVQAPKGYHPTVARPGSRNIYFWALGALTNESRRYDLAITDPEYR